MSKLREKAAAATRSRNPNGGRENRNEAMGPEFVADVKETIRDQMSLPVEKRLSVRHIFDLVKEAYPEYPNKYSAFRLWVNTRFNYHGAESDPAAVAAATAED